MADVNIGDPVKSERAGLHGLRSDAPGRLGAAGWMARDVVTAAVVLRVVELAPVVVGALLARASIH